MRGASPRSNIRGFTLIELLVVVAIIALLISILLPSLSKARQVARMVKCQAVLKQFGVANQMYANESEDYFVSHRLNDFALQWYTNIKWRVLAGNSPSFVSGGPGWAFAQGLSCPNGNPDGNGIVGIPSYNYGYNGTSHATGAGGRPILETNIPWRQGDHSLTATATGSGIGIRLFRTKVKNPSGKVHQIDATDWNISGTTANWQLRWDIHGEGKYSGALHGSAYRHNEGANLLMMDSHVEYRPKQEVYYFTAANAYDATRTEDLWHIYK